MHQRGVGRDKEMNKIDRALSGTYADASLLVIDRIPDIVAPIANALSGVLFMGAAFVLWSD